MQRTHRQIGKQRSNIIKEKGWKITRRGKSGPINVRQPQIKRLANFLEKGAREWRKKEAQKEAAKIMCLCSGKEVL